MIETIDDDAQRRGGHAGGRTESAQVFVSSRKLLQNRATVRVQAGKAAQTRRGVGQVGERAVSLGCEAEREIIEPAPAPALDQPGPFELFDETVTLGRVEHGEIAQLNHGRIAGPNQDQQAFLLRAEAQRLWPVCGSAVRLRQHGQAEHGREGNDGAHHHRMHGAQRDTRKLQDFVDEHRDRPGQRSPKRARRGNKGPTVSEEEDAGCGAEHGATHGQEIIRPTRIKTQQPDGKTGQQGEQAAHPQDRLRGGFGPDKALVDVAGKRRGNAHMRIARRRDGGGQGRHQTQ